MRGSGHPYNSPHRKPIAIANTVIANTVNVTAEIGEAAIAQASYGPRSSANDKMRPEAPGRRCPGRTARDVHKRRTRRLRDRKIFAKSGRWFGCLPG